MRPGAGPGRASAGAPRPEVTDRRGSLLRLGLPRDPQASAHLAGFLVATVATVMVTRGLLALAGYPQIGSGGLHVAHVLWGGLLMALGFVLLLSFVGPVARPMGALVGGVGFGLFVDEVGKFVTSDNDYFYEPTAALIYVVVVFLVLLAEALHGRYPHHPLEHLAGATDHAVAGLAGGFTPRARREARELLSRAGDVRGAAQVRALLDAVDDDASELPNPIYAVGGKVVRLMRRLVTARWVPWVTVGLLAVTGIGTVTRGLYEWATGADVPWWVVAGMLVSAAVSTVLCLVGLAIVRRDRHGAYVLFRRAVLVSLLVTQVFLFRLQEWAATAGLFIDLIVLGLVAAELSQIVDAKERKRAAEAQAAGPGTVGE